jgi:hypothetical protein
VRAAIGGHSSDRFTGHRRTGRRTARAGSLGLARGCCRCHRPALHPRFVPIHIHISDEVGPVLASPAPANPSQSQGSTPRHSSWFPFPLFPTAPSLQPWTQAPRLPAPPSLYPLRHSRGTSSSAGWSEQLRQPPFQQLNPPLPRPACRGCIAPSPLPPQFLPLLQHLPAPALQVPPPPRPQGAPARLPPPP